jgi:hypothetical protein
VHGIAQREEVQVLRGAQESTAFDASTDEQPPRLPEQQRMMKVDDASVGDI